MDGLLKMAIEMKRSMIDEIVRGVDVYRSLYFFELFSFLASHDCKVAGEKSLVYHRAKGIGTSAVPTGDRTASGMSPGASGDVVLWHGVSLEFCEALASLKAHNAVLFCDADWTRYYMAGHFPVLPLWDRAPAGALCWRPVRICAQPDFNPHGIDECERIESLFWKEM